MFTGTPEQLREKERQARRIADQIADLLTDLQQHGQVTAAGGAVDFPGGSIRSSSTGWYVR
ncbi:hypothetical protein [Streptomyces sp. CB03911]|uniref:hypothetical protein n=1 Tax=Streptomyces sp. CB03911 TaxID=1804758 RepID=UPI00093D5295|nr:hypothetical protein [Streptomyces sp. CB03911]OKI14192.1 hypothetical protein A6A07_13655 [Streptomyces sp. CB03911]